MIKSILILTVLAALVPTALSNVSTSADAEIALFSTASSDSNGLTISGNGDSAKMELKATNDDGKSNRVSGFQLTADNVLSTEIGDKATVIDNVDFTKAITTDTKNNQKAVGITSNGVIDFAGYNQGVYTLDVVVDDDRAYEAIIAIGYQTNQIVDKEITRVNSDYRIEFVFPPIKDPECKEGEELIDGKCEPIECDEGEKLIDGKCTPVDSCGCPIGDLCPTEACPVPDPCTTDPISPDCETPEPEPEPVCGINEDLINGKCEPSPCPRVGGCEGRLEDEYITDPLQDQEEEEEEETEEEDESEDNGQDDESGGSDSEGSEEEESGGSDSEGSEEEESGGSEGETSE